jgi:hypothetical protein
MVYKIVYSYHIAQSLEFVIALGHNDSIYTIIIVNPMLVVVILLIRKFINKFFNLRLPSIRKSCIPSDFYKPTFF